MAGDLALFLSQPSPLHWAACLEVGKERRREALGRQWVGE